MNGSILVDILRKLATVLAFAFSSISYLVAIRPRIYDTYGAYTLGFVDGMTIAFCLTALPLAYAYLREREKRRKARRNTNGRHRKMLF